MVKAEVYAYARKWLPGLLAMVLGRAHAVEALETPSVRLVSRAASPIVGPQAAGGTRPSISADGRFVVFTSSRIVVPGQVDSNGADDVFLLDRQTGVTKLVSHAAGSLVRAGNAPSGPCQGPGAVISSDGRFVAFCSAASDLVAGIPGGSHVYLYSRLDESVTLIDRLPAGSSPSPFCASGHLAIGGEGGHVAFKSTCMELVGGAPAPQAMARVFLFERSSGIVRLVSHTTQSETTPGSSEASLYEVQDPPSITADGSLVAFVSASNLLSDTGEAIPPQAYLYRLADRSVSLVSHAEGALGRGNDSASGVTISAAGRFAAYSSYATDLVAGFPAGGPRRLNVYLYSVSAGTNELASRAAGSGVMGGNGDSSAAALSADGSVVVFEGEATNLVSGFEPGAAGNVFLYSRLGGSTTLISRRSGSTVAAANGDSGSPRVSADGHSVTFTSSATDLVPGLDSSATEDLFLFDHGTAQMTLVSHRHGEPGMAAGAPTRDGLALAGDGRSIAFTSPATDITPAPDGNYEPDVFVFNRASPLTVLASWGPSGSPSVTSIVESRLPATGDSVSGDGRFVVFESYAPDLVPGQVEPGPSPVSTPDVFLHDRLEGETRLVSHAVGAPETSIGDYPGDAVISADSRYVAYARRGCVYVWSRETGVAETIDVVAMPTPPPILPCDRQARWPRISGDGNHVVFGKQLLTAGVGFRWQLFLWSRGQGVRLLTHAPGQPAAPGNADTWAFSHISRDGRYVAFSSAATNLTGAPPPPPEPQPITDDAFLYSRETDSIRLISHSAASNTTPLPGYSNPLGLSANGGIVAFYNDPDVFGLQQPAQTYLYRTSTEEVTLASHRVGSPLEGGNGESHLRGAVSADGSYLAFASSATDLAEGTDLNLWLDVFLYSIRDGSMRLVSHTPGDPTRTASGPSILEFGQSLSADGGKLIFRSAAPDLMGSGGTSSTAQVFVYDTARDELTLASRSKLGATTASDGPSDSAALSDDGRWVAFNSQAIDLADGDFNSRNDVFLFGPTRPGGDLSVGMAAPGIFTPGTTGFVTAVIVNLGPEESRGVNLTLTAPTGLNLSATTGACASWPCSLETLGAGQFVGVTLTFDIPSDYTVPDPAVIRVSAAANTPDLESTNDVGEAVIAVLPRADLELSLMGPVSATPPHQLVYTLAVTNRGPSDAVAVQLDDPTPSGLAFLSSGGDCSGAFPCLLGSLPPGVSRRATATFVLPETYTGPNPIHNVATVSSGTGDANLANNSASSNTILEAVPPPLGYYTVAACRLLDTRQTSGPTGGAALAGEVEHWFTVAENCGIPFTARAVVLNATVVGADGAGNVRLWAAGRPMPTASVVNYGVGQTRGANAIVGLNTFGALAVQATGSPHLHLILDVSGYFE